MNSTLIELFEEAAECTAAKRNGRQVGAVTVSGNEKGGIRMRLPKQVLDCLPDVKTVGVKAHDNYFFVFEKENGHKLRFEADGGAAVLYNGDLIDELAKTFQWNFKEQTTLHFGEWERLDGATKAVAVKVA